MLAVKNLPANAGDMKRRFDPEVGMANHSSVLAWGIPWTKQPGRLQSLQSCLTLCNLAHRHTSIESVILPNHPILCRPFSSSINNGPMVKSLLSGAHEMTPPSMTWAEGCTQETNLFATELSLCCWPVHMFIIPHFHWVSFSSSGQLLVKQYNFTQRVRNGSPTCVLSAWNSLTL